MKTYPTSRNTGKDEPLFKYLIRDEAAPDTTTQILVGDYAWQPAIGTTSQGDPIYAVDTLGNILVDTSQPGPVADLLNGSEGNDRIRTGELGDSVFAKGGNDIVEGGSGADALMGGIGNDRLYGNAEIEAATAIANGNADEASGIKGEWLSGNAGDDILISGADGNTLKFGPGITPDWRAGRGGRRSLGRNNQR